MTSPDSVWHSTGPAAEDGHGRGDCPGLSCPVIVLGYDTVDPWAGTVMPTKHYTYQREL